VRKFQAQSQSKCKHCKKKIAPPEQSVLRASTLSPEQGLTIIGKLKWSVILAIDQSLGVEIEASLLVGGWSFGGKMERGFRC
jgi:hypothetical protein